MGAQLDGVHNLMGYTACLGPQLDGVRGFIGCTA